MNKSTLPTKIKSPKRDENGRFLKGFSGNYNGRPKIDPNFRQLAKAKSEQAIYKLIEIFNSPGVYSSEAVSRATSIMLDLAFGKFGKNEEGIGGLYLPEIGMTYAEYLTMPYGLPREYLVQAKIRRDREIAAIMAKKRSRDDLAGL